MPSVHVHDLDRARSGARKEVAAVPGRACAVGDAVQLYVAPLVRADMHPSHGVEAHARKGHHRREVLGEGLGRRSVQPALRRGVDPPAAGEQHRVQRIEARHGGHGDEEVAAQEPHGILHRSLLVSGIGVAEPGLEAVMGPELGEELGLRHPAEEHPPRLGGIVEHDEARHAPCHLEYLGEPLAEALCLLAHHRDAEADVRMRERRDEELQLEPLACDGGGEGAIVGLHGARRPVELEEAVAWGLLLRELPFPHKAAHRRIGSRVALLGDEPVEDLLRAVALLPGDGAVVHEYADDKIGVPVDCRPLPPFRHRRLRGEVLHPRILVHAVAAHAEGLRYLGRPGSVGIHPSDTLLYVRGHGHLSFPPSGGTFVAVLPARKELWGMAVPSGSCAERCHVP